MPKLTAEQLRSIRQLFCEHRDNVVGTSHEHLVDLIILSLRMLAELSTEEEYRIRTGTRVMHDMSQSQCERARDQSSQMLQDVMHGLAMHEREEKRGR